MSDKGMTDDELLELGVDPDFNNRVDRWMTALTDWRETRLQFGSRRAGILEALTSTYWMFRMGPCHCWWFGKAFPLGASKMWQKRHPVLWRYFHIVQYLCKLVHARRDREWKRELDRDVFGDDYVDTSADKDE
jgi:hypothetical protein